MSPGLGLYRFAGGLALGGGLGLLYGLLRPVRRVWLRDLLFALGLGLAWAELAFRVCRGDIRLWYLAAMYLGAAAWERVFGAALAPIISRIWKFCGAAGTPVKIFLEFLKKNFATGEKWDIIRRVDPGRRGTARHGGQSIPPKQSKMSRRYNPMTEKKQSRTINVELQRADPKLKIALIVVILCSLVALAALRWVHVGLQAENQKLRSTAASVEYANSQLEEINAEPDSVQSVRSIAKQELGLVDPATVVIDPIS